VQSSNHRGPQNNLLDKNYIETVGCAKHRRKPFSLTIFKKETKPMAQKVKGRATIRTAAVLFLVSAVFEIMDFNSAAVLFGGVRVGAIAVIYHLVFAAFNIFSGIGMWTAKPCGYWAFMTTTAIYTIDKVQLILFRDAFYDYILQQLTVTRDVVGMIPKEQLIQYFMIAYLVLLLCWWGFAFYTHTRRQYFHEIPSSSV
jgi:hypothetical protein